MNLNNQSSIKWYGYFLCIISVFMILMCDFLSYGVWSKIAEQYQMSELASSVAMHISTIIIWSVGSAIILTFLRKKWGLDLFQSQSSLTKSGVILSIICVIIMTIFLCAISNGIKPVLEFQSAMSRIGSFGWIDFILQNIYYILEMLLALIMCILGQEAGETLTAQKKVPWGGFVLGVVWGLPHILSKNIVVGLVSVIIGIVLGLPYIFLNKNAKLSWFIMILMFIL